MKLKNKKLIISAIILIIFICISFLVFKYFDSSLTSQKISDYDRTHVVSYLESEEEDLGTYKGKKVIAKAYCSDVCFNDATETYIIYDGVNEQYCDVLKGTKVYVLTMGSNKRYFGCYPLESSFY